MIIISSGAGVTGAVTFAAGLHPYEGVEELITSVSRGAKAETGALRVAPVTPLVLACGLFATAAGVRDEVGIPAERLEHRGEIVNVAGLVADGVPLGIRRAGTRNLPGVVVGHIGSKATKRGRGAGIRVDLGE